MVKLHASDYMDDGRSGIVDDENRIVVSLRVGLSRLQAETIAAQVNAWLEARSTSANA